MYSLIILEKKTLAATYRHTDIISRKVTEKSPQLMHIYTKSDDTEYRTGTFHCLYHCIMYDDEKSQFSLSSLFKRCINGGI